MRGVPTRLAAVAIVPLLAVLAACGDNASGRAGSSEQGADAIDVGVILSLSGPVAPVGIPERHAIEAVATQINDAGGIDGREVVLHVEDDKTDPTESARAAQRLINEEGVVAILGPTITSGTLAVGPIAARAGVPVVSMGSGLALSDDSLDFYPWVFMGGPADTAMVTGIYERVVEDGFTKPALFFQEDAYGQFGADEFSRLAEEDGIDLVERASSAPDATDVSAQATRLRSADPDVILLQVSSLDLATTFVRTMQQVGLDVPVYAGPALATPEMVDALGEGASLMRVPSMVDPEAPTERQQDLFDAIEAGGNEPVIGSADVTGANPLAIFAAAVDLAGSTDGEALRDALESGEEFDAFTLEPYSYTADSHEGFSADSIVWLKVENGQLVNAD